MTAGWLVGRFEPGDIEWSKVEELAAWIRTLGLDPDEMALRAAVVQSGRTAAGTEGFELHLMRYLRNASGDMFLNAAANEPVWESVIVPVEKDSWPAWLAGMRCGPNPPIDFRSDGTELSDFILDILRKEVRNQGGDGGGALAGG